MAYKKVLWPLLFILLFFQQASYSQQLIGVAENSDYVVVREEVIELTIAMLEKYNTVHTSKLANETLKPTATQEPSPSPSNSFSWLGLKEKYLGFHGYLENRNYYSIHKNNKKYFYYQLRNNFRLVKEFNFNQHLHGLTSFDTSVYYFYNNSQGFKRNELRIFPREIYIDFYLDKLDIRIGKQVIRWGKSDEVNPTDVFTPEDLSEFFNNVERAKRKIPVFATKASYYLSDKYSLESVWLPFFTKTRLDLMGGNWEPYLSRYYRSLGLMFLNDDGPAKQVRHSSFATKLKREGENSDVSLSYSYHYSSTPALEVNAILSQVNPHFPRQHTIGSDFETVVGKFGIRGEAAYTAKSSFVTYDPRITKLVVYRDALNYIVGVDYTFPSNLYLNLQYAQQLIYNYPKMLATQQLEDSIVWRITKDYLHDNLTLKTTGRYYFSTRDLLWELAVAYKLSDNLNITLGFDLFEGEESGTFGQYKKNDQLFTRLKYSF